MDDTTKGRGVGAELAVFNGFLVALWVGVKLHKAVLATGGRVPWRFLPGLLGEDVLCAALWASFWTILLAAFAPAHDRWLARLFRIGTVLLVLLALIDHGFYTATGSLLDGYMLRFGIEHIGERGPVIASATPWWAWSGLVLGIVALVLPEFVVRRPTGLASPQLRRKVVSGCGAAVGAAVGLFAWQFGAQVPGNLGPLHDGLLTRMLRAPPENTATAAATTPMDALEIAAGPAVRDWNVVFVILESTRAQSVPPWAEPGTPGAKTMPFLAQLAQKGTRAATAYTLVPHTTKSIVPIHCGIAPKIDVANDESQPLALPVECLPAVLKRRGYGTAMFTSVDEAYEAGDRFAHNFGFSTYRGPESVKKDGFDRCSYFGFEDDILLEPSLKWVDGQKGPFVLSLLTVVPHHDYKVPKGFAREPLDPDNAERDRYYNCLRYADRWLQKLWLGFERRGLIDKTIFVIAGDHGEGFGEHGRFQHDNVIYEEGLRIPMLLVGPGVPAGQVVAGLRQNVDLVPTLYELLGLRIAKGELDGKSLLTSPPHDTLRFSCYYQNHCLAQRNGDLKAVYHYSHRPMEVFDLASDPSEQHDLVALGRIDTATTERWAAELEAWKARVNGRYLARSKQLTTTYVRKEPWPVERPLDVRWTEAGIVLQGAQVAPQRVQPGDVVEATLEFTLDAKTRRVPAPATGLFAHLLGPDGKHLNVDHDPVGGSYPLDQWQPGDHVRDRFTVRVPGDWPAGRYKLVIGLWNSNRGQGVEGRVPVEGAGVDGERRVVVGEVEVVAGQ
jgi:arylsulfatase A-like enzyme